MKRYLLVGSAIASAALTGLLGVTLPLQAAEDALQIAQVPDGYRTLTGDRWAFVVPSEWQSTTAAPPNMGNIKVEVELSDLQKQVFVNLVSEPIGSLTGDAYIEQSLSVMAGFGFAVHNQQRLETGAVETAEVESTLPSNPPIRLLQRIAVIDSTAYALTCGTVESNFEAARPTCRTILDSLEISQ